MMLSTLFVFFKSNDFGLLLGTVAFWASFKILYDTNLIKTVFLQNRFQVFFPECESGSDGHEDFKFKINYKSQHVYIMVSRLNGSPLMLRNLVPFFLFPVWIKFGRLDPNPV